MMSAFSWKIEFWFLIPSGWGKKETHISHVRVGVLTPELLHKELVAAAAFNKKEPKSRRGFGLCIPNTDIRLPAAFIECKSQNGRCDIRYTLSSAFPIGWLRLYPHSMLAAVNLVLRYVTFPCIRLGILASKSVAIPFLTDLRRAALGPILTTYSCLNMPNL